MQLSLPESWSFAPSKLNFRIPKVQLLENSPPTFASGKLRFPPFIHAIFTFNSSTASQHVALFRNMSVVLTNIQTKSSPITFPTLNHPPNRCRQIDTARSVWRIGTKGTKNANSHRSESPHLISLIANLSLALSNFLCSGKNLLHYTCVWSYISYSVCHFATLDWEKNATSESSRLQCSKKLLKKYLL